MEKLSESVFIWRLERRQEHPLASVGRHSETIPTFEQFVSNLRISLTHRIRQYVFCNSGYLILSLCITSLAYGATGQLSIVTDPPGATVVVDYVNRPGVTPITLELEEGEHRLQFELYEHAIFGLTVTVKAGMKRFGFVRLVPLLVRLHVELNESWNGTVVAIDSIPVLDINDMLACVPCTVLVEPGYHKLSFIKPGQHDFTHELTVSPVDTTLSLSNKSEIGISESTELLIGWLQLGKWLEVSTGSVFTLCPDGTIRKQPGATALPDSGTWIRGARTVTFNLASGPLVFKVMANALVSDNVVLQRPYP